MDITTSRATAYGDAYRNLTPGGTEGGKLFVFRPYYPLTTTVTCPAGETGVLTSPVWAMFAPQVDFPCTGASQTVVFPWAAAPNPLGRNVVEASATLYAGGTSVTDTQTVTVITRLRK